MSGNAENKAGAADAQAILAAWRAQGADRLNPIRFHFIEALSRRAAGQRGHARRVLDEKLAALMQAYKQEMDAADKRTGADPHIGATAAAGTADGNALTAERRAAGAAAMRAAPGALAGLLAHLALHARTPSQGAGQAAMPSAPSAYPELPLLDYFRDTWSRYSTRHQLRRSQERVPENAGPLNSSLLVHRTLSLMREVSPEYLHQFLSYIDALSWMEQATRIDLVTDKEGARPGPGRKAARGTR